MLQTRILVACLLIAPTVYSRVDGQLWFITEQFGGLFSGISVHSSYHCVQSLVTHFTRFDTRGSSGKEVKLRSWEEREVGGVDRDSKCAS